MSHIPSGPVAHPLLRLNPLVPVLSEAQVREGDDAAAELRELPMHLASARGVSTGRTVASSEWWRRSPFCLGGRKLSSVL